MSTVDGSVLLRLMLKSQTKEKMSPMLAVKFPETDIEAELLGVIAISVLPKRPAVLPDEEAMMVLLENALDGLKFGPFVMVMVPVRPVLAKARSAVTAITEAMNLF